MRFFFGYDELLAQVGRILKSRLFRVLTLVFCSHCLQNCNMKKCRPQYLSILSMFGNGLHTFDFLVPSLEVSDTIQIEGTTSHSGQNSCNLPSTKNGAFSTFGTTLLKTQG